MNNVEVKLKELILRRYGTMQSFCTAAGLPWTTLDSILKRGVNKANIQNLLKITTELGIDVESLANGEIVYQVPSTIAAHFEGDDMTPEEMIKIMEYAAFLKSQRDKP